MSKKKVHPVPAGIPERIVVTDTLDLHGFFPEQIPEIINAFVGNAVSLRLRTLRIVHGKGKSRLKFEVVRALERDERVAGFRDAPPELGGWGATIVELNGPASRSEASP